MDRWFNIPARTLCHDSQRRGKSRKVGDKLRLSGPPTGPPTITRLDCKYRRFRRLAFPPLRNPLLANDRHRRSFGAWGGFQDRPPRRRSSRGKPSFAPSMTSRPPAARASPAKTRMRPRFTVFPGAQRGASISTESRWSSFRFAPIHSLAAASRKQQNCTSSGSPEI